VIIERAEIPVIPGKEEEFEAAMGHCKSLLSSAKGCRSIQLARGVENPSKYLLIFEWESIEDHIAFTRSPAFEEYRDIAGPYFAAKPAMEHFAPVAAKCPFTAWIRGR